MAKRGSRERTLKILAAIPDEIRKAVRPVIEERAQAIIDMQKRAVPVKSGKLKKSIRYVMGDAEISSSANLASGDTEGGSSLDGSAGGKISGDPDLTATIIAGDEEGWYARFVEFGTAPHKVGGKYATTTHQGSTPPEPSEHPGTRAHPFFYGPFRASKRKAKSAVTRALNKAVKAAAHR